MKKALFYAVRRMSLYQPVIAVTKEKPNGRWYGRDTRYNCSTHGCAGDLVGRFETFEQADECRSGIVAIGDKYDALRKEAMKEVRNIDMRCRDEIEAYVRSKVSGNDA